MEIVKTSHGNILDSLVFFGQNKKNGGDLKKGDIVRLGRIL